MKVTVLNGHGRYDGDAEVPDYIIDNAHRLATWMKAHGVAQIEAMRSEPKVVGISPVIYLDQWSSYRP